MAGVTILALISYFIMPEEAWLPRNRISHFIDTKGVLVQETVDEIGSAGGQKPSRAGTSSRTRSGTRCRSQSSTERE